MSASDPGACTGTIPREPDQCACGHLETLHTLASKRRAGCTDSRCPCKQYEVAAEALGLRERS